MALSQTLIIVVAWGAEGDFSRQSLLLDRRPLLIKLASNLVAFLNRVRV